MPSRTSARDYNGAEVSSRARAAYEIATIRSHRWWSIEEIRRTTEAVYPEDLADRLEAHLAM
jgi:hypothetical protein